MPLLGQRQRVTGPSLTSDAVPVEGDDCVTAARLFCGVDVLGVTVGLCGVTLATVAVATLVVALFAAVAVCVAVGVAAAVLPAATLEAAGLVVEPEDALVDVVVLVLVLVLATCLSGAVFNTCPGKMVYGFGM